MNGNKLVSAGLGVAALGCFVSAFLILPVVGFMYGGGFSIILIGSAIALLGGAVLYARKS